jgi:hypothetical protein
MVSFAVALSYCILGCAIAQSVIRRFLTAAARVRAEVRSCGICGGQNVTRAGFHRLLWFPLQIIIPPAAPHTNHQSPAADKIGQISADVPSALSFTPH